MVTIKRAPVLVRKRDDVAIWECSEKRMRCVASGMGPTVMVEFTETKQRARVCIACFNDKVSSGDWAESESEPP